MGFYSQYPAASGGSANASVGTNGVTAPTSSTEVAGINPSGNLQPLQTNATGALITTPDPTGVQHVIVDSSALPTGASTSAAQTAGNASLTSIDSKTPALGQAVAGSSVPVVLPATQITALTPPTTVTVTQATGTNLHTVVDSGSITVANASIAVTGPLTDTQLRATPVPISGSVTTGGLTDTQLRATPVPISGTVTANAGTNLNTSALALETTQSAISGKLPTTLGQKASAASLAVVLASDQSSIPVAATLSAETTKVIGTVNLSATSALAANQSTNISQINGVTPLMGNGITGTGSLRVTVASDNTTIPVSNAPSATSTNALSSIATTALVGSLVIKASAGRLYSLTGYNNATTSYFIQLHNTTSAPADGAIPVYTFLVPAKSNFSLDFPQGRYFSTGIFVCDSTTVATKTVGAVDCWFNAEYL